ncbi:MAG TPA: hypothetical protein VFO11_01035, partial [Candidatus Polarisedimenticolaceae bacterium]|nr:hypothetical protein [Candidatus Polarisedimenticolaceae bacterium]
MRLWEELAWQTNLSPAECISKIRAYTATDTIGRFLGLRIPRSGTLLSSFDGPGFRLIATGSIILGNSADSYFYGTVSEVQGRTLIHGSFRLHPLTLAALVWVLACAVVIGLVFFILGVAQLVGAAHPKEGEFPTWLGLTLLPQMLLGGVTLTA